MWGVNEKAKKTLPELAETCRLKTRSLPVHFAEPKRATVKVASFHY